MYFPDQINGQPTPKRDVNLYHSDIVYIGVWWHFILWSLSLQAPIQNMEPFSNFTLNTTGKEFFQIHLTTSINFLIKNNKAGVNGETLSWPEILILYKEREQDQ